MLQNRSNFEDRNLNTDERGYFQTKILSERVVLNVAAQRKQDFKLIICEGAGLLLAEYRLSDFFKGEDYACDTEN